ncbi:MAG: PAS domain-containing protein [Phycisphaerales bacterium]|nr:PAS domain-containing protein [Phycisphaerales bacterium]
MAQARERSEEQLKEVAKESRNLEALIDALDEPVVATDNRERVLLCNRSAEAMFHSGPGGLRGRPISSVFTQAELLAMHAAARSGETRRGRVKIATVMGPRVFQVSAAPVPVAWGEGVFGAVLVLRDVTELDRAVQVKTDFVANASHELRTPVSAIRAAAETLQDGGGGGGEAHDPKMTRRLLEIITSHAGRLEEMVRDLLDLSRLESSDVGLVIETVQWEEIAASLHAMFDEECRARSLRLEIAFDPSLAGVATDSRLLLLALRNLVENAAKFAYEGTSIRVSGRRGRGEAVEIGKGEAPGWVRMQVADKGLGIPLAYRERVFERYFQVDPSRAGAAGSAGQRGTGARRGTGLGLSIVKHAVKALGGEVGLESVWKEGTTVWIRIPADVREHGGAGAARGNNGG